VGTRHAVAFFLILSGILVSINDAQGQDSISVPVERGERITVFKKDIDITTISKQSLYDEMLGTYKKQLEAKELYDICLKQVNSVQCWQMYNDDIQKAKQPFPYALQAIDYNPLYLVIRFPALSVQSGQAGQEKKDFVVCLNPAVPNGYWQDINRFKPILKSIPDVRSNDPKEVLKKRVCDAYAVF
jgi:hypothetical protein